MSVYFRDLAEKVVTDGVISPEDVLALRRVCWDDGEISPEEAEAICVINGRVRDASPEWRDFFVEAISECVVNGMEPRGYVNQAQAEWLIDRIDHDGQVSRLTELELLARVFERASSTPDCLRAYALTQIERAMLADEGVAEHHAGHSGPSGISEPEVRLLRRFVFAGGGARSASVGREEAEMLFRLKDATSDRVNTPGWERLFVQGAGNFLMGFSGHQPLTRERAREMEAFMNDTRSGLGRFFGRMFRSGFDRGFEQVFSRPLAMAGQSAAVAAAARNINDDEKLWLENRLDADDRLDPLEQALLTFIAEETGNW